MSENKQDKVETNFYKWITGILVSSISFFLVKTYNKLDKMEDVMQQQTTTNAIQEIKIDNNSTRINTLEKRVDDHEKRLQNSSK